MLVDDPQIDAGRHVALLGADGVLLGLGPLEHVRLQPGDRAERGHLGHAPGVQHRHAELLLEELDQRLRRG